MRGQNIYTELRLLSDRLEKLQLQAAKLPDLSGIDTVQVIQLMRNSINRALLSGDFIKMVAILRVGSEYASEVEALAGNKKR